MSRSHPPTLLTLARRAIVDHALVAKGEVVLAAVSGGPDSMALVHVLALLSTRLGFRVVGHGIDHGLRDAAQAELDLAAGLCASLGVPFAVTRVAVPPGSNLMARARAARLDALASAMRRAGAAVIATGHHADDRAETVLLRLLRGAGPAGLAALPPKAGPLVRPLLCASRADVLAHLSRHRIAFAEDPTNRDPRYLRTRVRGELLPLLGELSPRIVEHLCALADALGQGPTIVPAVLSGRPLGRAQRVSLTRALETRNRRARISLKGGEIAGVELASSQIVVMKKA